MKGKMGTVRIVNFNKEYEPIIRQIRNSVFTLEQEIDETDDFDGHDFEAIHTLVNEGGKFVGTGRMLKDGHIGRLAVLKEWRGKGIGTRILMSLVEEAKRLGLKRVCLGAQRHAIVFYRKNGFSEFGDPYYEVGVEHVHMEKFI